MTSRSLVVAFALAARLASAPMAIPADEPDAPFADIPNVTIIPYDVTGRSAAAVRRAIDAARPTDPNDGNHVDGLSHYQFRWSWHSDGLGKCSASLDDISFSATVTVPRLVDDKASPKLREQFDRYRQSLLAHEDGHIRYAWNHRHDIADAINAATCATASTAARDALKAIVAHDIAYDKATRHGTITILPFG